MVQAGKRGSPGRAVQAGIRGKRLRQVKTFNQVKTGQKEVSSYLTCTNWRHFQNITEVSQFDA